MLTSAIERGCFDQRLTRVSTSLARCSSPIQWHVSAIDEIVRQCGEVTRRRYLSIFRFNRDAFPFAALNSVDVVPKFEGKFSESHTTTIRVTRRNEYYRNNLSRFHLIIPRSCDILLAYIEFSLFKFLFIMSKVKISTILLVFIV